MLWFALIDNNNVLRRQPNFHSLNCITSIYTVSGEAFEKRPLPRNVHRTWHLIMKYVVNRLLNLQCPRLILVAGARVGRVRLETHGSLTHDLENGKNWKAVPPQGNIQRIITL